VRVLAGCQEGFDEFAVAADRELLEAFEPFAVGDFGVGVEPCVEFFQRITGDVSLSGSFHEVADEREWDAAAFYFRHGSSRETLRAPAFLSPRTGVW